MSGASVWLRRRYWRWYLRRWDRLTPEQQEVRRRKREWEKP